MFSENTIRVLRFLQEHPQEEFTKQDMIEELGLPMATVNGAVLAFRKKDFVVERQEVLPATFGTQNKPVILRWIKITESGLAYDPIAEEKKQLLEKAETAALRRKERAEKKHNEHKQILYCKKKEKRKL